MKYYTKFCFNYVTLQERTDSLPKCAFQIDSLLPEDRACINSFGVEPHNSGGICDGAEQMKVQFYILNLPKGFDLATIMKTEVNRIN